MLLLDEMCVNNNTEKDTATTALLSVASSAPGRALSLVATPTVILTVSTMVPSGGANHGRTRGVTTT